ncbi:SGNH/GDSL hydrolase family protein [Streptomyces sp. ISL-11]|uniref:SGNH/GDSL hydrolase family protein n=1 Tax=Streptomyces sp. ISL-11 TaxID=2819174 RepID=UPI001BE8E1B9|nr:SGNH/GDSL hydrolase family protein [Streptomyces sp. ISL-11]MBT2382645.1 SGNH/GDSL hydrolase family protein [Streptomyces sp. ISL-11]
MNRPALPRSAAYVALAALAAAVILVSAAIFVGVGGRGGQAATGSHEDHGTAEPAASGGWVGAWGTSPAGAEPNTRLGYAGQSIRNVVHTSIGGTSVRIQLSNLYGSQPLSVTHASVALAAAPGTPAADPGSMRRLAFTGQPTVTIPAGQSLLSDPVRLTVPPAADLLVTTYSPTPSGPVTYQPLSRQMSYLAHGDRTEDVQGAGYTAKDTRWRYLTAVDVWAQEAHGTVVAFGDSITAGYSSTTGTNRRWPDFLAARLRTEPGAPRYGVLNEGISGNRVLLGNSGPPPVNNPSGLERFERDVLGRTGVRVVIMDLGVNDILRAPQQQDPHRIVSGLRQMVERAHGRGLRVVGATLAPFAGHKGTVANQEITRQGVNELIRAGGVFDDVVDFDRVLRDPRDAERLLPAYDSGDHLHPSDAGYAAMARAIDLETLKGQAATAL